MSEKDIGIESITGDLEFLQKLYDGLSETDRLLAVLEGSDVACRIDSTFGASREKRMTTSTGIWHFASGSIAALAMATGARDALRNYREEQIREIIAVTETAREDLKKLTWQEIKP